MQHFGNYLPVGVLFNTYNAAHMSFHYASASKTEINEIRDNLIYGGSLRLSLRP